MAPGAEALTVSLSLGQKAVNMNRPLEEPLDKALTRLARNLMVKPASACEPRAAWPGRAAVAGLHTAVLCRRNAECVQSTRKGCMCHRGARLRAWPAGFVSCVRSRGRRVCGPARAEKDKRRKGGQSSAETSVDDADAVGTAQLFEDAAGTRCVTTAGLCRSPHAVKGRGTAMPWAVVTQPAPSPTDERPPPAQPDGLLRPRPPRRLARSLLDRSLPNGAAWPRAALLEVGGTRFAVELNPPCVDKVRPQPWRIQHVTQPVAGAGYLQGRLALPCLPGSSASWPPCRPCRPLPALLQVSLDRVALVGYPLAPAVQVRPRAEGRRAQPPAPSLRAAGPGAPLPAPGPAAVAAQCPGR
jgi:hypothetical protein